MQQIQNTAGDSKERRTLNRTLKGDIKKPVACARMVSGHAVVGRVTVQMPVVDFPRAAGGLRAGVFVNPITCVRQRDTLSPAWWTL
jgi:hypothetical protein